MIFSPTEFDRHVPAFDVADFAQAHTERGDELCVALGCSAAQKPDHRHLRLLRARRERPRGRAPEQRDEVAPLHSITSSATASSDGGTARPSTLAVVKLMTRSNLVGCSTGMS